jgi:V8-like Glu-specific endopeptidase
MVANANNLGRIHYGTGFFVNFPSTNYDVILTAGHNLVNEEKVRAQNLIVIYYGSRKEKVAEFKICPQYEELLGVNPKPPSHGYYDYGVILLPKDECQADKRLGLGLDLSLNIHPSLQGLKDAFVSGYGDGVGNMPLQTCFSPLKGLENQIEYYQGTAEQGMSGSPVWVTYDGQMTVIGLQ